MRGRRLAVATGAVATDSLCVNVHAGFHKLRSNVAQCNVS